MNKIYVVGIGPGAYEKMTIEACETLKNCDVIIGYTVYVEFSQGTFPGENFPHDTDAQRKRTLRDGI